MQDLTGKQFNSWTVLNKASRRGHNYYWKCKCKCGVIRDVRQYRLIQGITSSCGCLRIDKEKARYKDFVGKKFGKLIVIEFTNKKSTKGSLWRCKCDCGNECFVAGSDLIKGHKKSCNCLLKELSGENHHNWGS